MGQAASGGRLQAREPLLEVFADEVLVDCVTYIVCSSAGLDVGGESIPYIAGRGEDSALDAIREYGETVDTIARRIEHAVNPGRDAQDAAAAITA